MTTTPKPGTLYGVGVGPGAPDLLTLRAVSVLQKTHVVLAAASTKNEYSTALEIARPHLPEGARIVRLAFPMTHDEKALALAWEENARIAASCLEAGDDAVFLTLGDPLIYSTFGYLMRTVNALFPHIPVAVVPGVTSFQAAAAATRTVLCEKDENFLLLPGVMDEEALRADLRLGDNAAILKAYKTLPMIQAVLASEKDPKDALFVSRLGLDGEVIAPAEQAPASPNYLSLILATKKNRV
ncbi:Precorrin-2 C20-methyltransferase [uncultured delta proteobacterium]|uniref:Precorrin-2 C20-methyltransferase n=1 Tax=uncultured delta proteobacterium TaxID=34034 RepID=A0A212JGX6_9DELT|nr:Precorrin-2 C20-methyltransferase [uncultured delta proteobacterium]